MSLKSIMVCLDGSKNSLRGLDTAILFAKQSNAMIIGVHSDTSFSAFSAVRAPILPEEKWKNEQSKINVCCKEKSRKK